MRKTKRLFLLAAFDKDGIIDDALLYYVRNLALYGRVIICMDSQSKKREVQKLRKYVVAPLTLRHFEYDFGSYKRCFQYAKMKDMLKDYEYVYLVNDSVFGPTFSMKKLIHKMERIPLDAVGMIKSKHKTHEFMESWFVRLNKNVFMAPWFEEFLASVQREDNKETITIKYEHGLTNLIKQHKCSWDCIFECHGRFTYNRPKQLFKMGCPFIKKASFTRHNGAAGGQIKYVLDHSDEIARKAIMKTANRVYGKNYMKLLLTHNPLKIMWRNVWYALKKLGHKKHGKN